MKISIFISARYARILVKLLWLNLGLTGLQVALDLLDVYLGLGCDAL
ncbi:hypothetical protein HMPREF1487_09687 [Pseudomonas sp. HPB0071]|nr:hypothetical protein [Pseudomonas sp. WAC2]ENA26309.1 hypothetical protein HMPREF1487_09687 [Pseudomonas sp. HPB0071]MDN3238084.1 hypothetical protein [Pseudomonas sp. WAC2]